MAIVSKNQPITEGIQMLLGAINGDPEVLAKQKAQDDAFMLEQARTDAYARNVDAGIADMNAKLALQEKLNAAQIGNYGANSAQSMAAAAKANAERDSLAAQLDAMKQIPKKLDGLFAPVEDTYTGPLNTGALDMAGVPSVTRPKTQEELYAGLGDTLAPLIVARGGDPSGLGDFLLATQALGANTGSIPQDQQEGKMRNALIGSGKMPDLNTALTTGRQTDVINLNAANDQVLERIKPPTTSNLEAKMWTDMLDSGQATPEQFLNRDASTTSFSTDANGNPVIEQKSGGDFGPKLTEVQGKYALFASRAAQANQNLEKMMQSDYGRKFANLDIQNTTDFIAGMGKTQSPVMQIILNSAMSPEGKQMYQAQNSFLTAVVRPDSGAALVPDEWLTYGKVFLPMPGDDEATLLQKKADRELATSALAALSNGGANVVAELMVQRGVPVPPELRALQTAQPAVMQEGLGTQLQNTPVTNLKSKYGLE